MNIILPELKRVRLHGYSPIFNDTIEFKLKDIFILLGGNGLGKTTILQSVIYAIAGSRNSSIELETTNRWDRNYFKERLQDWENAFIEIDFFLGKESICLKRGFTSGSILEFYLNNELITSNIKETDQFFEQFLIENAGYNSLSDFNFIFHKLCYLSEKRENLVWDVNAQTRILMRLVADATKEAQFNNKRRVLKKIDSAKRHLDVDYNKLSKSIEEAEKLITVAEDNKLTETTESSKPSKADLVEKKIERLQKELINSTKILKKDRVVLNDYKKEHSKLAEKVDLIRDQINSAERNYFLKHIQDLESKDSRLAIYKIIHNALCPSCGSKSKYLQALAKENLKNNKCALCGTDQTSEIPDNITEINLNLSKSLGKKIEIEQKIISIERRMEIAQKEISDQQLELNKYLLNRKPVVLYVDKSKNEKPTLNDIKKLKIAFSAVSKERNSKIIEFNKLREELEKVYLNFNKINNSRIKKLSDLYKKYASEFLGMECTLQQGEESDDKFLDLKLLVPKFNNIIRSNPDSCSEAQRFFLDIALRMAFIELSRSLSSHSGTFICETPESALDITYINNVSDMFKSFSFDGENSILMSSNIQSGGIAQSLLSDIKPLEKKAEYFLNMIEIGNLSDVQSSNEGKRLFTEELDKILQNI